MSGTVDERCRKKEMPDGGADNMRCWEEEVSEDGMGNIKCWEKKASGGGMSDMKCRENEVWENKMKKHKSSSFSCFSRIVRRPVASTIRAISGQYSGMAVSNDSSCAEEIAAVAS